MISLYNLLPKSLYTPEQRLHNNINILNDKDKDAYAFFD